MRVVLQRVREASVVTHADLSRGAVNGQLIAKIGRGLLVLAGFEETDGDGDVNWMAGKIVRMRLFANDAGVMNRSVQEVGGEILAVSRFTLYASVKKGNRPSWSRAARGDDFAADVPAICRETGSGARQAGGNRGVRRRHARQSGE